MSSAFTVEHEDVEERLKNALTGLLRRDRHLLDKDLSERSICFRLGLYLQRRFPKYTVDCEYNGLGDDERKYLENLGHRSSCSTNKRMAGNDEPYSVYPDIIVHKRGLNGPNLLALEVKKTTNDSGCTKCDSEKLEAYLRHDKLQYCHAAFIQLATGGATPGFEIKWMCTPHLT